MPLPQRLTAVTFGARNVAILRRFYGSLGWQENEGSDNTFTSFDVGGVRIALYPIHLLGAEAAPGADDGGSDSWNGTTLTLNVATRQEVDDGLAAAGAAGGTLIGSPVEREWGGYSGYFADPEGHRWEVAWAPWITEP